MKLAVFCDGGARGNPGPAAAGVVIFCQEKPLFQTGIFLGRRTNNEAEYQAVILALEWLEQHWPMAEKVTFYLDSRLVVSQVNGHFRLRAANLRPLLTKVKKKINQLKGEINFVYVPREKNQLADQLVNQALDCQENDRKAKS